jgi:signal transduction histidine kinase
MSAAPSRDGGGSFHNGLVLRRLPEWIYDLLLAGFVGAASIGNAFHRGGLLWFAVPASVAGTLLLLLRRRYPLAILVAETALAAALAVSGRDWLVPAVLAMVWTVASRLERRRSLPYTAGAAVTLGLAALAGGHDGPRLLGPAAFFAALWLGGDAKRASDLDREERMRRAAVDERARIARELHDVVTHNVSVMVVQAAAGNDVFASHPERAREALRAVEETGRRALGELRRLLDVTGDDDGALPQPGLARVDELVANVRRAGLAVELNVQGTPRRLPEALDLSAYRIVQEALTNTLKHAHASRAAIVVRYGEDDLDVEVTDDGVGSNGTATDGRGLIGMRERVALFGGDLRAGTASGGGYTVRARLPLGST